MTNVVHPVVSNVHEPVQLSVPLVKPCDWHVSPDKSVPSHCSVPSITSLPHIIWQSPGHAVSSPGSQTP